MNKYAKGRPKGSGLPEVTDDEHKFRTCGRCEDEFADLKQNWKYRLKARATGLCILCARERKKISVAQYSGT